MANRIKRLRVFAGPNGSGKSTLYEYLVQIKAFHSYYHINPDMIAKDLAVSLNLDNWPIDFTFDELTRFLDTSSFQSLVDFSLSSFLDFQGHRVSLKEPGFSDISYLAAAFADFLRIKMLQSDSSFSFETVFSHSSKIKELEDAKKAGFKIYLYFITTADPLINSQRVKNRVENGGHDVPDGKICTRYFRAMNNLHAAFRLADRTCLFDNSSQKINGSFDFFAEKNGKKVHISNPSSAPEWFDRYVLKYSG